MVCCIQHTHIALISLTLDATHTHTYTLHAGITTSAIKEDDPLALIGEQLLYISESSVTNMVRIGEGNCILKKTTSNF